MSQVPATPVAEQQIEAALARLAERTDAHEGHRAGHAGRIATLAGRLARRMGLGEADVADVRHAALAHGLGLYTLRLGALERSGPLTLSERVELWRHPLIAEQQLARRGASRHAQLLVRWYHEWWNGRGYPDMLAGRQIPLGARILRIAETYEALCSDRPHREALDPMAARRRVAELAGTELDPDLTSEFLTMLEDESWSEPPSLVEPVPRPAPISPRTREEPR